MRHANQTQRSLTNDWCGTAQFGLHQESYADALLDVRNAELVACFSRNSKRSESFAEKWKITACATMDDVCADPRVEIVIVALPNELHLEAVEIAYRHKKAIICTKPLGRTEKEAQAILDAANGAGVWHGYARARCSRPMSPRPTRWSRQAASASSSPCALARVILVRTQRTSGMPRRRAAGRCSTWAATRSNRRGTSLARTTK